MSTEEVEKVIDKVLKRIEQSGEYIMPFNIQSDFAKNLKKQIANAVINI